MDSQAAAEVATAVMRLATGKTSNVKWFGGIGVYRIDRGPGYRVYFARDGAQLIVLFGGGTKRRQQADVARAKELHVEYAPARRRPDGGRPQRRSDRQRWH